MAIKSTTSIDDERVHNEELIKLAAAWDQSAPRVSTADGDQEPHDNPESDISKFLCTVFRDQHTRRGWQNLYSIERATIQYRIHREYMLAPILH